MRIANSKMLNNYGWCIFAIFLVALYTMPTLLFGIKLISNGARDPSLVFDWYFALASKSTSALAEIHQLILPLVTGMSVATYSKATSGTTWALIVLCLICFTLVMSIEILFGTNRVREGLEGLSYMPESLSMGESLLSKQRSNLILYLAVLLGLKTNDKE